MSKKRAIIWGAWHGSKNVGNQALLLSITDMLGNVIEDVEFIVITANPAHINEYTKKDSAFVFHPLHSRKQFLKVVQSFFTADVFIFGGGVPFYDEISHSLAIALLVTLARIFRVPCVLWVVSSLFIRFSFSRSILRYILSYSSVVTYRDSHTHKLFNECGREDSRQQMAADPVFTLRSNDQDLLVRARWQSSKSLVALTPRTLRRRVGRLTRTMFQNQLPIIKKRLGSFPLRLTGSGKMVINLFSCQ